MANANCRTPTCEGSTVQCADTQPRSGRYGFAPRDSLCSREAGDVAPSYVRAVLPAARAELTISRQSYSYSYATVKYCCTKRKKINIALAMTLAGYGGPLISPGMHPIR